MCSTHLPDVVGGRGGRALLQEHMDHHGLIKQPSIMAEQGHWMGRPGQATVKVLGPANAITGVEVAGSGHVLMSGELLL